MENDLMDKNKSTFKLKNIGPIYYINLDGQPERKDYMENIFEKVPLNRMANWSDYNGAILFLASDASKYMTGSNLVIDGGWTAW